MRQGLKIYACSGVGETTTQADLAYYTDGEQTMSSKRSVNSLLVDINVLRTYLACERKLTQAARLDTLAQIDLYWVCLQYAKQDLTDDELARAGRLIAQEIMDGSFALDTEDADKRDAAMEEVIARIDIAMRDGSDNEISDDFTDWWEKNVVSANTPALDEERRIAVRRKLARGVSGVDWGEYSKYINDAGAYFLYIFTPENKVASLPAIAQTRRAKEIELYNYIVKGCVGFYVNDEDAVRKLIYAGCWRDICYNNANNGKELLTPEEMMQSLVDATKKVKGVGVAIADDIIVAIIGAIATIIVSVLSKLIDRSTTLQATQALADSTVPSDTQVGVPDEEDWGSIGSGSSSTSSAGILSDLGNLKLPLLAAGAAFIIWMFKKK